jgi:myosin-1
MLEEGPEGILVSVKPKEDPYDGLKLRRQNSIDRKFYGDYMYLNNQDWFKSLQEQYNDREVSFSSVVSKINKVYKKQERILVITDRAIYSLDPSTYAMKRRIELFRLKSLCVSPLNDGFFVLRIPDEYDYLYSSPKKTEILTILQRNYKNATRGDLKCDIQVSITYKPDNKTLNPQTIKFRMNRSQRTLASVVPKPYGADILVRYEDNHGADRKNTLDIYQGQKLRRRDSLVKQPVGDYLHIANTEKFHKLCEKHDDKGSKLLFSGIINKINQRYQIQSRIMVITETGIYNMDMEASSVKRKIPITSASTISISTMRDNFFIVRVPDEYDYFFETPNKTEVIKTLLEQYKKLTGKQLDLQVDDKLFYRAYKKSKGVRTIDFQDDNSIRQISIQPTSTGAKIKVNNEEKAEDDEIDQQDRIANVLEKASEQKKKKEAAAIDENKKNED